MSSTFQFTLNCCQLHDWNSSVPLEANGHSKHPIPGTKGESCFFLVSFQITKQADFATDHSVQISRTCDVVMAPHQPAPVTPTCPGLGASNATKPTQGHPNHVLAVCLWVVGHISVILCPPCHPTHWVNCQITQPWPRKHILISWGN